MIFLAKLWNVLQVNIDFEKEPVGISKDGKEVYFRDIWPSNDEIAEVGTATLILLYLSPYVLSETILDLGYSS